MRRNCIYIVFENIGTKYNKKGISNSKQRKLI